MKYIGFLRGINVSGQRLIKMEFLRSTLSLLGLKEVKTYIQSGNFVFESDPEEIGTLTKKIEEHLYKTFSYEVPLVLRTPDEISEIIATYPFDLPANHGDVKVYVTFLSENPQQPQMDYLISKQTEYEFYHFRGYNLYVQCLKSSPKDSPFSNNFIEKTLKIKATTRNWNTVNKMLELSQR